MIKFEPLDPNRHSVVIITNCKITHVESEDGFNGFDIDDAVATVNIEGNHFENFTVVADSEEE